jgi:hypothetical protein
MDIVPRSSLVRSNLNVIFSGFHKMINFFFKIFLFLFTEPPPYESSTCNKSRIRLIKKVRIERIAHHFSCFMGVFHSMI